MADVAATASADPYFDAIASRSTRETVESILIALVLVVMFRAFVSEPFIIPTGSMAPGLMGYHLDVECDQCGQRFAVNASKENPYELPPPGYEGVAVAGICPVCRYPQAFDRGVDREYDAYAGDRILVNKFSYLLAEPQRWSVIVFNNPYDPYQNYIKRLIGLPGETLQIYRGDIRTKPTADPQAPFVIACKPPQKVGALLHIVDDTERRPPIWKASGFPERWRPSGDEVSARGWKDRVAVRDPSADEFAWMEYRHVIPTPEDWRRMEMGLPLDSPELYEGELITDFYAYNAHVQVSPRDVPVAVRMLRDPETAGSFTDRLSPRGLHWVGDLALDADLVLEEKQGAVALVLIEGGRRHVCTIDLATGVATATMEEGGEVRAFSDGAGESYPVVTARTNVVGPGRRSVRFANCDDQLYLWVDGRSIEWDRPGTFERAAARPAWSPEDPGDLAPARIGAKNTSLAVEALRVFRDVYYISLEGGAGDFRGLADYEELERLVRMPLPGEFAGSRGDIEDPFFLKMPLAEKFKNYRAWASEPLFATDNYRVTEYQIGEDCFMPLGDNSPASQDARYWPEPCVPRDLMIGEALCIYWPHAWNRPIPMITPNVSRMKFIR
ncbi:MAG TPA: S26 family signal peptidase [Pirellulaceae bacterium]|jgi:signal peptidase I|nr:S26 family signal peptidase [Pirellulaceae bacterium]